MKHGARFRGSQRPALDRDLDGALDALTVGELRSVVREALERLDREPRGELLDSLIARARLGARIDVRDRVAMLKAMQAAARKRVAGILGNKRRRHYEHAAILVACCLELDPVARKPGAIAKWVADLRRKYSRFEAFQKEVDHALAEVSS